MKRQKYLSLATIMLLLVAVVFTSCQSDKKAVYTKDNYTYKVVDGCEIKADIYRFPDEEIRPAIIWIHPGGLITGSRSWISSEQVDLYLEAGYAVISIDYRLAPETKLESIVEDLTDAYNWVRKEGPGLFKIDPDQIAIVGHSGGGYLALVAGYKLNPLPDAIVSFYGYGNITADWVTQPDVFYTDREKISEYQANKLVGSSCIQKDSQLDGRFDYYIYTRQLGLWAEEVSGHDPENDPDWFVNFQPLDNIGSKYPPTILLHGERDSDVPFEQSVLLADTLASQDVEFQWIRNSSWGHVFDQEGLDNLEIREAFDEVIGFLNHNVH